MVLRPANIQDLPALARLHSTCFTKGWTQADFAQLLDNDHVLVTGEPINAFVVLSIVAGEAEIITIGVEPANQSRGQGSALLAAVLDYAGRANVSRMVLEVALDNPAALALYARAGFGEVGRRKGYYSRDPAPSVDALVLAKLL